MGKLINVTDTVVDIRFAPIYSFQKMELSRAENREVIEKEMALFSGSKRTLHLTEGGEDPKKRELNPSNQVVKKVAPPRIERVALQDEIEKEPIIQKIIDIFNGEVL